MVYLQQRSFFSSAALSDTHRWNSDRSWSQCCRVVANKRTNQHPERCPARNDGEFIDGESATFCRDTADDNRKRRTDHHRVDRRSMCVTSLRQRPARQPNQTACRPMKYFVIGRQRWRRQRRVGSLWRPRLSVGLQPARTGRAAVKSLSRLRLVQRPAKFTLCRRAELSTVTVLRDVLGGDKRCRKKTVGL